MAELFFAGDVGRSAGWFPSPLGSLLHPSSSSKFSRAGVYELTCHGR